MNSTGTRIISKIIAAIIVFAATLFLHFYLTAEGEYPVAKTIEHDSSIPHISFGKVLLHAETFGNDTCQKVIVLHDGPGHDYRSLLYLQELADEYLVIFYDRRGTGLSPRVNIDELTPDTMLNDLLGVKHYYAGKEPVNLVAHAWAGELAKSFFESYPRDVLKVVILGSDACSCDPCKGFYYVRDMGLSWFKSLHVRKPDPQAARDYFFATKAFHPISGAQDSSCLFWRYGALAKKAFSNKILFKVTHDQPSCSLHEIPTGQAEKNLDAIRNLLNLQ